MDMHIANASNEGTQSPGPISPYLKPVFPDSSGEGLPYAPENWPQLGDIWTWKVGKRYTSDGNFIDRYLYLPARFRGTEFSVGNARMFKSKKQVERYIREKFPSKNIDEFFASFSWKIPAKSISLSNGNIHASLLSPLNLHVALPYHEPDEISHETDVMEVRNFEVHSNEETKSLKILSISSDYDAECQKLETEIDRVLQNLKKSQETEYKLAEEKLIAQRTHIQNLYDQLGYERSILMEQNLSSSNFFLPQAFIDKMEEIKREVEKLKDMEEVAFGFGKTSTSILNEYYGIKP